MDAKDYPKRGTIRCYRHISDFPAHDLVARFPVGSRIMWREYNNPGGREFSRQGLVVGWTFFGIGFFRGNPVVWPDHLPDAEVELLPPIAAMLFDDAVWESWNKQMEVGNGEWTESDTKFLKTMAAAGVAWSQPGQIAGNRYPKMPFEVAKHLAQTTRFNIKYWLEGWAGYIRCPDCVGTGAQMAGAFMGTVLTGVSIQKGMCPRCSGYGCVDPDSGGEH